MQGQPRRGGHVPPAQPVLLAGVPAVPPAQSPVTVAISFIPHFHRENNPGVSGELLVASGEWLAASKVGRPGPGRRDVIKDCAKESVGGSGVVRLRGHREGTGIALHFGCCPCG